MIHALHNFIKPKDAAKKEKERPASGNMAFKGMVKNAAKLKHELAALPGFSGVGGSKEEVTAMMVESTDKNKNPYLYISFSFGKGGAVISYSIPPEIPNPSLRRLQVSRTAFTCLSILEEKGAFVPDRADFYTKAMEAFEDITGLMDTDTMRMRYELGRYSEENARVKEELAKSKEEKDRLGLELLELQKSLQNADERLKKLEGMTDRELDREIIRWVGDHDGKLNDEKFCASFGINGQRLEERLDSLSKRGVVRLA